MLLADHHRQFQSTVMRLGEKVIAPIADEVDRTDQLPLDVLDQLAENGLVQLVVPEAYGGPGGDLTSLCLGREAIARCGSMALAQLVGQNGIVAYPILHFGTEEQKQRFLPALATGVLACVGLTEAGAGSNPTVMTTRARQDGSTWVVNGHKSFISYGKAARYCLLFARTSEGKGARGISAFVVETDSEGFVEGRHNDKLGGRGIPNVELFLEDLRVPAENMIGQEGEGFAAAMRALHLMRPPIAAIAVGGAQAALDYAIGYARAREQGGIALAAHQGLRWMLADMATQTEAARSLLFECARQIDAGLPLDQIATISSMAKWKCAEVAMGVATDAVQVLGAAGYMRDHPVERYLRDAKLMAIYEGTSQIQLNTIARGVIG